MNWDAAESAIRSHIESKWAMGSYTSIPLVWENEDAADSPSYMAVLIEGIDADKWVYGGSGKKASVESGMVFIHCFIPRGWGKAAATAPVRALTQMIELQTIAAGIKMEGGLPPSPADLGDAMTQSGQPGGQYYRCSGAVPFIVLGTR
jgi:hypothetical protein